MLFFLPSALHSHQLSRPCTWASCHPRNGHVNSSRSGGHLESYFLNALLKPYIKHLYNFLYFIFESVLVITFSFFTPYKAVSLRIMHFRSLRPFMLLPHVPAFWCFLPYWNSQVHPSFLVVDGGKYSSVMGQKLRQFDCQPSPTPFSTHRYHASLHVSYPSVGITLPPQAYLQSPVNITAVLQSI